MEQVTDPESPGTLQWGKGQDASVENMILANPLAKSVQTLTAVWGKF